VAHRLLGEGHMLKKAMVIALPLWLACGDGVKSISLEELGSVALELVDYNNPYDPVYPGTSVCNADSCEGQVRIALRSPLRCGPFELAPAATATVNGEPTEAANEWSGDCETRAWRIARPTPEQTTGHIVIADESKTIEAIFEGFGGPHKAALSGTQIHAGDRVTLTLPPTDTVDPQALIFTFISDSGDLLASKNVDLVIDTKPGQISFNLPSSVTKSCFVKIRGSVFLGVSTCDGATDCSAIFPLDSESLRLEIVP
jgi:hypothetical protein